MIDPERLLSLLDGFADRTVLVVGDLMLDEFTWGRVRRISPEAPVPVVEVEDETYRVGGSANVSANIRSLGGVPRTVGVIGKDAAGERLRGLLEESGISSTTLIGSERPTTRKTRLIGNGRQVARADREDRSPLADGLVDALTATCLDGLDGVQAVVVSDYDKGVVGGPLLARLLPEARGRNIPVFLDPKVHHADYYRGATVITPNLKEAELLSGMAISNIGTLRQAGRDLLERFDCSHILITRSEDGMALFARESVEEFPAAVQEVSDVTGAGDTVIGTLALAHAAGGTMAESAWLANQAAGVVVGKVGTATLTRSELERIIATG